jgi:hypothetical protein
LLVVQGSVAVERESAGGGLAEAIVQLPWGQADRTEFREFDAQIRRVIQPHIVCHPNGPFLSRIILLRIILCVMIDVNG